MTREIPASAAQATRTAANIVWHAGAVGAAEREAVTRQRGCVLWFTGLSGSGKSTVARALEAELVRRGHLAYVLDGDNVRHGLSADLDFSPAGRAENVRRIGEVAALFADAGLITIAAFVSPCRADRDRARGIVERALATSRAGDPASGRTPAFIEVFVDAPLAVCEARDPKGLYAKARAGQIPDFTGIGAPYEPPLNPDITLPTGDVAVADSVRAVMDALRARHVLET
jgi:adenylylsulfate kinase